MCASPAKPKPVLTTCTPNPIQINSIYPVFPGVPIIPVQPQLSHFIMQLFGSPVHLGLGPSTPFQHHISPLALRPAERLSAVANILHWRSSHIA
ncbi:tudor domain-containing protein 5-like [Sinocyclocheilus grahami]|nr:PREDICTED: tudor domain-containing protein 5-like [Sinocyclocheilus grahami]